MTQARKTRPHRRPAAAAKRPGPRPRSADSPRRRALAGLLVAMTVVAYLPALRAGFVWDDDDYVTDNKALRTAEGLRRIWVEPRATPQSRTSKAC